MSTLTPLFGSIIPSQKQQLLDTNFLSFNGGTGTGDSDTFAQQYLPEIYEQEVERYGNRTLSGFLRMVGAEMPMTSDQVIWSEQNRLHIAYDDCTNDGANGITIPLQAGVTNVISVNSTVVLIDKLGAELKAVVTGSEIGVVGVGAIVTVAPYTAADTSSLAGTGVKMFVYGSEYDKGSSTPNYSATNTSGYVSVDPSFTQFSNSPIIIRSKYVVSGSDTAQIGWVEVATEDGTGGYLWYLKAESETRLRFEDYLEMSVVEGEKANPDVGAGVASAASAAGYKGTQGLFAAIKARGNVEAGYNVGAGQLASFDEILRNLDTQGAIEENMLFLNRETALGFDDMLAGISAGGEGGTAYGLFENSEDMALNLGFSGFRRGSYDFYKTDWKYLNDASTRGAIDNGAGGYGVSAIDGVLIPAGTSTVYDQVLGSNIRRPFLHVRYRASQTDDRRMKSWLTGSVGGAFTSDLDAMEVNFLSERCLCVQGANNFVLFTK